MAMKGEDKLQTQLIPQATVEEIVARRNRAIDLYNEAYEAIVNADAKIKEAHAVANSAAPMSKDGRFTYHLEETRKRFYSAVALPDRAFYLSTAKRITDTAIWQHIITVTDLERVMDKKARDDLHKQMMEKEPPRGRPGEIAKPEDLVGGMPEISEANIYATLERFNQDAELIFRRGIVNSFSSLDRRFRSHNGFKIGSRVILDNAFSEYGSWNYRRDQEATIYDIEKTLAILDGKPPTHRYAGILQVIDNERGHPFKPLQSEHQGDYFKIRIYKNGNAHLWFTRDDLVKKVNLILADHYGEAIGDAMTEGCEADPFSAQKTAPAKYFGFHPTPLAAAKALLRDISFYKKDAKPTRILEPSAGTGNLALFCQDDYDDRIVDCVEIQPHLAERLQITGIYGHVYNQDFLALSPETTGLYDFVVMNPPFNMDRDIDHVMHAWKFVAPGGELHAIMSAGTEFAETRKAIAFREFADKYKIGWRSIFEDLPAGSFSEVGTHVNTVIVRLRKPA